MSRAKRRRIAIALAVASTAAMLTGCGSSSSSNGGGVGGTSAGLAGGCIPITGMSSYYGGVSNPQLANSAISFTGTNIRVNSASIVGGNLPPNGLSPCAGQNNGQVIMTGSIPYAAGAGVLAPQQLSSLPSYDGMMTLTSTNYIPTQGSYYGGVGGCNETGRATMTGQLQISPQTQNEIIQDVMNGVIPVGGFAQAGYIPTPYNPLIPTSPYSNQPYPNQGTLPQVCISNVAFDMGYNRQNQLFGVAYVYLNNSSHGIKLQY